MDQMGQDPRVDGHEAEMISASLQLPQRNIPARTQSTASRTQAIHLCSQDADCTLTPYAIGIPAQLSKKETFIVNEADQHHEFRDNICHHCSQVPDEYFRKVDARASARMCDRTKEAVE